MIDRWKASGQSVVSFCAVHRVTQATFYSWCKRLGTRTRSTTPSAPAFAPVRVVADPTAEVVLPNGLIVRVPAATDPAAVARLDVGPRIDAVPLPRRRHAQQHGGAQGCCNQ
jgi:hypothetical protein